MACFRLWARAHSWVRKSVLVDTSIKKGEGEKETENPTVASV